MKNCKDCKCATCVRNSNICLNTPTPCAGCFCEFCGADDFSVQFCNQHLTIDEVNLMVELVKKGLTHDEAYAIIKAQKER